MKKYNKMTFTSNVVYGSFVGAGAFLVYKKRHTVAWYLTSCYSKLTFYTKRKQENNVKILNVRNAHTLVPLSLPLQNGYDDHIEVCYSWNNKKYSIIYQPFLKVIFPPYEKEKLLCSFVGDYEFYVRNEKGVTKIDDNQRLKTIYEIMGPLCDFYVDVRSVISPRKALLHYKVINANEEFLMYDLIMDEEKSF
mgnify:FL=1